MSEELEQVLYFLAVKGHSQSRQEEYLDPNPAVNSRYQSHGKCYILSLRQVSLGLGWS
jgi:hypothetical protein